MRVLVFNCGSSTLKFELLDVESCREARVAGGIVDRIGELSVIDFHSEDGKTLQESQAVDDHGKAGRLAIEWLDSIGLAGESGPVAVGHRIIHGGAMFRASVLIDDEVVAAIDRLSELAPLHNQPSLAVVRAVREIMGETIPMVAVFDTAFHSTMPEYASQYAIPQDLAARHRIRRYGFHGLAHRFMMERYSAITRTPSDEATLITIHLGNGCSATAVRDGRAVDTTMGFTPLEGLMMGTRSGDCDPSLAGFIARRERLDVRVVEDLLNKKSGLLGVSGYSRDMREILKREHEGDDLSALAVEMFCYRVKKCLGSYMAVLGGADAFVFGGGIGENAPQIRARILGDMQWCGVKLDSARNRGAVGGEVRITTDDAKTHAYVIAVDEALLIARDTLACLKKGRRRDSPC